MSDDGSIEFTSERCKLIGELVRRLDGLALDKVRLLADAAEVWEDEQHKEATGQVLRIAKANKRKLR